MILKDIWMDVKAVQERDPAARSALEVLLLYQGVHALIWHRFAHWFYKHHMFFIARLISQIARFFTLIEIHPGAQLGHGILIDHGCGVVIGETTVVGDNCTIYQGVTLGGVGLNKGKRHQNSGRFRGRRQLPDCGERGSVKTAGQRYHGSGHPGAAD